MSKTYTVTLTKQYPAWDEKNGLIYPDVSAKSKAEAVKIIRQQASHDGNIGPGQGLYWIKAEDTGSVANKRPTITFTKDEYGGWVCDQVPTLRVRQVKFLPGSMYKPCWTVETEHNPAGYGFFTTRLGAQASARAQAWFHFKFPGR